MPAATEHLHKHNPAIRLIAVDLDGTLLGEDGAVSPRNLAALHAAQDAGVEVVAATGRRHCYAMRVLRQLGLHHGNAIVSSNGTVTRTLGSRDQPSQLLARAHLPHAIALQLVEHLRGEDDASGELREDFRNALVLTFDRTGPDGEDAHGALVVERFDQLHASIGKWMEANAPYIAHVNPIESALTPDADAPIQAMLCGTVDRMARAEARIRAAGEGSATHLPAHLTLHSTEYPARDLSILDILPTGCSKGTALLALAAARGLEPSQMMTIGDNWNDVSMLEIAGQSILMANAPDDLKAIARRRGWHIGPANTADGVAEAIETTLSVAC